MCGRRSPGVVLGIGVEQLADHALVLRVVLARLRLEELDAALAQGDGHLHALFAEDEILRARQKIRNDSQVSEGLVRVLDFLAPRFAFLFASSRLRGSGSTSNTAVRRNCGRGLPRSPAR